MSWVKSVSHSVDDVFDVNAKDISLQNKEWSHNMEKRVKDGFVEGIDAGKEAALQAGFNQGFKEGVTQTKTVGCLKGVLSAVQCWYKFKYPQSPIPTSVTELFQRVVQYEDALMDEMMKALQSPTPSVSDVSESMEDLEVNQGDPDCMGEECKEENCCRGDGQMDLSFLERPKSLSLSSDKCWSNMVESSNQLLQSCIDLVLELGLPQELIQHLEELRCKE
ncbi:OTU deubiquitinase with linear linkage specificity a [Lampris incognitus]|uniref:OTU deubiquitinase with linear linkage specificity a n=1 Tax=Lampris incognitus TaxID=2546036 RepID=UPI0024B5179B|nr:OTU deubiquitinase with linear linkage specificity a [Lampris incognitus]